MEKILTRKISQSFLVVLLLFLGFFFLYFPGQVRALNPQLRLTPPFTELIINDQNPEASFDVQVTNSGSTYETFAVSVIDFGSLDRSGGVAFIGTQTDSYVLKYGLASWVVVDKNFLQVPPGQTEKITVTIVDRESLSPGGHYAAILLSSDAEVGSGVGNVSFNYAFSSLIFAKKLGGEIARLDLNKLELLGNPLLFPNRLRLTFQNTGNIHLTPRGEVVITDPVGRQVARSTVNPESGIILPESFRDYPTNIRSTGLAFLPGLYRISLNYRFDGQDDFTLYSVPFFYLGLPFMVTLLLCILIPAVYFWFFRRRKTSLTHVKKNS